MSAGSYSWCFISLWIFTISCSLTLAFFSVNILWGLSWKLSYPKRNPECVCLSPGGISQNVFELNSPLRSLKPHSVTSDHSPVQEPACAFTDFQGQVLPLELASVWRQTCCFVDSSCMVGFIPPLSVYCRHSPLRLRFIRGSSVPVFILADFGFLSCLGILYCQQNQSSRSPGFGSHPRFWCHIIFGSAYSLRPFQWRNYKRFLFIYHFLLSDMLRDWNFLVEGCK